MAALVSNCVIPDLPDDLGLVEVHDTLEGLQKFAAAYRSLLPVKTVGVTGSSGKTSTKELIAAVLRTRFKTKATQGNLNNHIGVPLTLIRLDEGDEYGVVEMGMNHPGEIAPLAKMTVPRDRRDQQHRPGAYRIFCGPGGHCRREGGADRGAACERVGGPEQRRRVEPAHCGSDARARGLGGYSGWFDLARRRSAYRIRCTFLSFIAWCGFRNGQVAGDQPHHGGAMHFWQLRWAMRPALRLRKLRGDWNRFNFPARGCKW